MSEVELISLPPRIFYKNKKYIPTFKFGTRMFNGNRSAEFESEDCDRVWLDLFENEVYSE